MDIFSQYHDAAKSLNITQKVFGQVKAFSKSQDKRYKVEPFTGGRVEQDLFYDPLKCKPFYMDKSAPVWYGRVENMQPEHQHLLVYGFVTMPKDKFEDDPDAKDMLNKEFVIRYNLSIRGKDADKEEWNYFENSDNTVRTKCSKVHDICAYFPVGFVPFLEFDMYDVMVEIQPSNGLTRQD